MKTFIILGAIAFSTGAFAQTRTLIEKEAAKTQSEIKQKTEAGQQAVKDYIDQKKDETTQKVIQEVPKGSELIEEAKDLIDLQDKTEKVDAKISEGNAAAAKAKAETVETEEEAEEMIEKSKEETKQTISSIDSKMVAARTKLTEKLEAKEITQDEFNEKIGKLMEFEKRKNAIISSME